MYLRAASLLVVLLLVRRSLAEDCTTSQTTRSYLNETFHSSQVLVSGTHLKVRVRRVFKGREHLKSRSSIDVIVPSSFKFCISVLLVHDTRVFPLSIDGQDLTLSAPVLPINLSVLDSLHSFILRKPHKKRKKAKKSHCESQLCPLGSKCVFST
ncbi:hypothetical protein COOONC_21012 [Cooperia oncophora]